MRRFVISCVMLCAMSTLLFGQDTSWTQLATGSNAWLRDIHFVSRSTGWAVGYDGTILKSTNQGASWTAQVSGSIEELNGVAFRDSLTGLVVGGCNSCGGGVILKTTNAGAVWEAKDLGHALTTVAFSSPTKAWALGCDGLILKSTDAGETWSQLSLPDLYSCLSTIDFVDDSTGWIGGYIPGVVLKTTDGGENWTQLTDGIDPQQDIDGMHFLDREVGWLVGYGFTDTSTIGVITKTTDGGATWTPQVSGVPDPVLSVEFSSNVRGWAVTSSGTILGTGTAGAAWQPEPHPSTSGLEHLTVRGGEAAWIVGLDGTIFRKDLGGLVPERYVQVIPGWNIVSVPMAGSGVQPTAVFPGATSLAYAYSASSGYVVSNTLNNGVGYWLKMPRLETIPALGTVLDSVTVSLSPRWNLVGGISDDIPIANIKQDPPGSVSSIFGYSGSGYSPATTLQAGHGYWMNCTQSCTLTLYRTVPGEIPPSAMINPLRMRTDELPPPSPGESSAQLVRGFVPASYALHQNYPNPFNPSTTISVDLPEASMMTLSVFNMLGQEIATIASGLTEAGSYAFQWSPGREVPSGVYLCKITAVSPQSANAYVDMKKMILMK